MGEALNIMEVSCPSIFSNNSSTVEISDEEAKLSCIFNEEVHHIPTPPTGAGEGIQANDIGSLLEQFLEYEQGSEGDASSRQDSYFITPVGSPGGPNDDVVLGRLMIVQEKLTQEVENNASPSPPPDEDEIIDVTEDNNNVSTIKLKVDGLFRTVNGIHPKGNNIRMADSPKFAKFKKKKQTIEIPRRCQSGPTTPKCTSPPVSINQEEMKKREAQLIEALALTASKGDLKMNPEHIDADKAKRNLNDPANNNKRKISEPISSRMMPVISKRQRKAELEKQEQINRAEGKSTDPRLIKMGYCETSNTTYLMNTNLVQVNTAVVTEDDDTTVDHIGIVDMTIDHEALAGTIITPSKSDVGADETFTEEVYSSSTETDLSKRPSPSPDDKNSMIQQLEKLENMPQQMIKLDEIKQEPVDFETTNESIPPEVSTNTNTVINSVPNTSLTLEQEEEQLLENTKNDIIFKSKAPRSIQLVKPHSIKPPKNYRQNIDPQSSGSDSESDDLDYDIKRRKRKIESNKKIHPSRSRSRAQSRARTRSRSPIDRSRANSPTIPRSQLYDSVRSKEDGFKSKHNSDEENIDISNKLSELSNPVPYDIEHERKVQFLVGKSVDGYTERKNIYVGGINKQTTKQDLIKRFRRFGKIEKTTLHFRAKGDNYAFIVYEHPGCAMRAIEEGNDDPSYPRLELCFGGRRKFVGGSYVDFDGNNSYLEETEQNSRNLRCDSPENDFDSLLKMATQKMRRKREETPEWD
eukprot:TCONS_00008734-protein